MTSILKLDGQREKENHTEVIRFYIPEYFITVSFLLPSRMARKSHCSKLDVVPNYPIVPYMTDYLSQLRYLCDFFDYF